MPFEAAQYDALARAHARAAGRLSDLPTSRAIPTSRPGRKTDPGPHFDWARYRASIALPEQSELSLLRPLARSAIAA